MEILLIIPKLRNEEEEKLAELDKPCKIRAESKSGSQQVQHHHRPVLDYIDGPSLLFPSL